MPQIIVDHECGMGLPSARVVAGAHCMLEDCPPKLSVEAVTRPRLSQTGGVVVMLEAPEALNL